MGPTIHTHPTRAAGRLVWIYSGDLRSDLDAATWLQATHCLRRLGWAVTLVTATPDPALAGPDQIDDVAIDAIAAPRLWFLGQTLFHLRALALILARRKALDAVLFHEMSALWLLPLRLLGRRRPRLVMDTRTLFMAPARGLSLKARLRAGYLHVMRRLGNRLADGRLCITPAMAEACQVPAHKLWGIWPSAVSAADFAVAAHARRWPQGEAPVMLCYVGVLHTERCLQSLCAAVLRANAAGVRFHLTLVGDGSARDELARIAAHSDGTIRVLPPVAHARVPQLLQQAHLGALPFPDEQKFRVSSPIKLFEYAAAGLPILATRIRCHTDVLGARPFVYWAESNSVADLTRALERIWQTRSGLRRLGAQAAGDANAWTWAASAKRLSDALRSHLGTPLGAGDPSLSQTGAARASQTTPQPAATPPD
ncbi:glycosyltransferase family 4 protein [uncultured Thiohalocapsa sp.]|uniref:glycosyltransferase family 4 protein n=1 Tax=uncultured Thiohalocapsa sp. TaxID=768990 RepID=UPI0025D7CD9A|nr:glycosyltransferase family 4 protein [uncultured Thiohalocapsa sp.]